MVARKCKGCGNDLIARHGGTRYCNACGIEATAASVKTRRAAKRALVCECGQPKTPDYIRCIDCRRRTLEEQARDKPKLSTRERAKFPRRLPVGPLAAKLTRFVALHAERDQQDNLMVERVLEELGVCARRFYEWREGRSLQVSFPVADRVLTAAGWDWGDVWTRETAPALFDALDAIDALGEAEADGFCPVCSEWVATINQRCPWHERPVPVESSEPFVSDGSLPTEMAA
jgi:uncharacterized Zn finger protein (UPF0148 family)